MKKSVPFIGVLCGLVVAVLSGICAQDVAYWVNGRYPGVSLITMLSIVTAFSIGLFLVMPLLLFVMKSGSNQVRRVWISACVVIGVPVSMFSIFILAMWMG